MLTAPNKGTTSASRRLPVCVDRMPTTHGRTAPPVLPLAKTALVALRSDSPNHCGNNETLIGKMEARPRPARIEPGISVLMPPPHMINKPPVTARVRPSFAIVTCRQNLRPNGARNRPASNAPQKKEGVTAHNDRLLELNRLAYEAIQTLYDVSVPT